MTKQRGFTLVELMIVIAIVAVLSTLAIVYMSPQTKAIDVATRFGDMVSEASRLAAQYGPVRADVAAVNGTHRTYIDIDTTTAGPYPTFQLHLLIEDAEPATTRQDVIVQSYNLADKRDANQRVTAESFATTVGAYADVTPISDWSTFTLKCYSNGTCEPRTLFFSQGTGSSKDRQARVSVMPLGAATYVRPDWM